MSDETNDTDLLEELHDEMLELPCVGSTEDDDFVDRHVSLGDVLEVFEKRLTATPSEGE